MNAPDLNRSILKHHIATVEAAHPIKIIGMLPRGSATHRTESEAIDLLGEKRPGLSYFGLAQAEIDLGDLIGRPVGIILTSEVSGEEARNLAQEVRPL